MVRLVALSFAGVMYGCGASQNEVERIIANWAQQQLGSRFGSGECTALLEGAEDAARSAGHSVPGMTRGCYSQNSIYCWSDTEVSLEQAEPGDAVQFYNWDEKYDHRTNDAHHHTAIFKSYDGTTLQVWEQNQFGAEPNGNACVGYYHPNYQTKWGTKHNGAIHVFRLGGGSAPAPNPSPSPPAPTPSPSPSPSSCTDKSGWVTQEGDDCSDWEKHHYCTSDGSTGRGWKSRWGNVDDATYRDNAGDSCFDACCACGGGNRHMAVTV